MKPYVLRLSLLALLVGGILTAHFYVLYSCGPGIDYERTRVSYVDPDLLSDSLYQSLYQTLLRGHQAADTYYDEPHEEFQGSDWLGIYDQENIQDWKSYLGNDLSDKAVYDMIYRLDTLSVRQYLRQLESGKPLAAKDIMMQSAWGEMDTLHISSVLDRINQRSDVAFLRYLNYAHQTEPYAWSEENDDWEQETTAHNLPAMNSLIDRGIELYRLENSDFLRLRYAYQVVRMARYVGKYQDAVGYYDRMVAINPLRSPIRYRALSQKAGAVRLLGDTATSNFLFAQVFDSSEGSREISLRDYRVYSDDSWDELYALARNDHDRTLLWFMRGLKGDGLDYSYLEKIYSIDPASPYLSIALLRELHRIETFLYDDAVTRDLKTVRNGAVEELEGFDPETDEPIMRQTNVLQGWREDFQRHIARKDLWDTLYYFDLSTSGYDANGNYVGPEVEQVLSGRDYVLEFRTFVLDLAKKRKVAQPALWYMVAGYIDIMDGDLDIADQCLDEARDAAAGDYDLRHQISLLDYLRQRMDGKSSSMSDAEVAEVLQWMANQQQSNHHSRYNRTMTELGRNYLIANDVPRAILAFAAARDAVSRDFTIDLYASESDLAALQKMIASGGKGEVDRLFLDSFELSADNIADIRATRMMREGKYREADQLYSTIPVSYWSPDSPASQTTCFRFTANTVVVDTNLPKIAHGGTEKSGKQMTRREFASEVVRLLDQADAQPAKSDSTLLKVANLLYNTPYWGYSSVVWDGSWLIEMRYYYFGPTGYPFNIQDVAERMEEAQEEFLQTYGTRNAARGYYRRIMEQTSNRELAAHCAYMIDLCDKQPQTSFHPRYEIADQPREGYDLLIRKYRDTRYAQAVLSQCSVYRYFPK